ncbi:MAG: class F sortase, partial [Anaerolineae bacterium]|nr:class F sortase [Anaerolineae bacterium]
MPRSPYERRPGFRLTFWQFLLMMILLVGIVLGWDRLSRPQPAQSTILTPVPALAPGITPTMPDRLTSADVLPTPTIDPAAPQRTITFPGALVTSRIINAARTPDSWETRYLGDAVGHLQGTSWIGEPGGNVVLAGHVTNERGEPGPFAYLFEAQVGDEVLIHDGDARYRYRVAQIEQVAPEAVEYVYQDGIPRLTLITCDDWNFDAQQYDSRLVVVA